MVGFTLMKVSLCSHSVSPPKPSTITPDSHSIGETLPIFIFDTSMATAVAAMKAAVAVNTPARLLAMKKASNGPKSIASLRPVPVSVVLAVRSEEHTSELQSLMRRSYAAFCLQKKVHNHIAL